MSSPKDLRRAPRYDYECSVLIVLGDEGYFSIMENISSMGCCIHRPKDWTALRAVPVKLFIKLGRHAPAIPATTIWSNDNFVGFEYSSPQSQPPELLSITVGHDEN